MSFWTCYLIQFNMPLWNLAQRPQTGLDASIRKCVCWIGASMSSSFRLQQDVDTASISILDLMLQKVGQLSVYIKKNTVLINGMPTYLIVYSYQMIAGIVIGINFVITFFFWWLNSSLTYNYCFHRVQLYQSSIKWPWMLIQSLQCYNTCSKMNVLCHVKNENQYGCNHRKKKIVLIFLFLKF